MKTYIIYFEIFGKKMKTIIEADSKSEAKQKVKNKIIFHKIDGEKDNVKNDNIDLDGLKNMLGIR
jgi:hypothetical protein